MRTRNILTLSAVTAILFASPMQGRADEVSTQIIGVAHSPVSIQRCQVSPQTYDAQAWVNVENRTKHQLISVEIKYSFYDADKAMFSQAIMQYTPSSTVAPGDIQQFSGDFYPQHSEPFNVTSYVTCRVNGATFTGEKSWKYGQSWPEPLVSANSGAPQSQSNDGGSRPTRSSDNVAPPNLKVQVLSAWQDPGPRYQGGIYVHDRISIAGADRDVTVHPHDFVLRVVTNAGQTQSIHGLAASAPQYLKANYATNQSVWTPTVAVDEDLGAHGSLEVPAHGSATTVVTFYVQAAIDTSRLSDVAFL